MKMIIKKNKNFLNQSFFLTLLLVEIIIFWITKNRIGKVVFTFHLLIIISLLIYFITNINFSNLKLKIKKSRSIIFYFGTLILLYFTNINYSDHLNNSVTCKNINSVISIYIDCSYTVFFFFFHNNFVLSYLLCSKIKV